MQRPELELQCECPHCGKSAYHTIRWLRENPSLQCMGCENAMPSAEVLRENSTKVRQHDEAASRHAKN